MIKVINLESGTIEIEFPDTWAGANCAMAIYSDKNKYKIVFPTRD